MSDETSTAVAEAPLQREPHFISGVNASDVFAGGPGSDEATRALAEALSDDDIAPVNPPAPTQEFNEMVSATEELTPEQILGLVPKPEAAEPVQEEVAEEEPAGPDAFDTMLADLNALAGNVLGQSAVPVPVEPVVEAPVAPAPVPVPATAFSMDVTSDQLFEIATDPEAYKSHMAAYAEKIKLETLREIGPSIISTAFEAFNAYQFEKDVFAKYPKIAAEAPNLLVVAYRKAKEAMPNAPYDQLRDSIFATLDSVNAKKDNIVKSGAKKDIRGTFAPKANTRTVRPNTAPPAPADPTRTALAEIAGVSLDSADSARHLRAMGL